MIERWRNMSQGNSREDSKGKTNQLGSGWFVENRNKINC